QDRAGAKISEHGRLAFVDQISVARLAGAAPRRTLSDAAERPCVLRIEVHAESEFQRAGENRSDPVQAVRRILPERRGVSGFPDNRFLIRRKFLRWTVSRATHRLFDFRVSGSVRSSWSPCSRPIFLRSRVVSSGMTTDTLPNPNCARRKGS